MLHALHALLPVAVVTALSAQLGQRPTAGRPAGASHAFTLAEHGIILEVAQSTIKGAGRGVFVRCPAERKATLAGGTALCGYASGTTRQATHGHDHTDAVAFCLRDPGFDELHLPEIGADASPVWFEGALWTANELLSRDDVDEIAGHIAIRDELGELDELLFDDEKPYHFCPDAEQPEPSLATLGILVNDLAYHDDTADVGYEAASASANLLAHIFEVARDEQNPRRLVPTAPITTVMRDATLTTTEPVELGAAYGADYWGLEDVSMEELQELAEWMY